MGVRAASHTPSRRVKAKQLALTIPGTTVAVGGDDEWIFRMRVPRKGDQTHFNLSLWDTQESVAGNQMPGYFAAILRATQDEGHYNSVRKSHNSGNRRTSSIAFKYPTPAVPPVPRLKPMMR